MLANKHIPLGMLVLALLVLAPLTHALQATDAESLIVNGHYLHAGDRAAVFKALPQTNGSSSYWLVSVYQNDVLRTLLPVADKDSVLVPKGVLRTNLISAHVLIQRLTTIKNATPWLISLTHANKLSELATAVENEQFDLDIVSQSISSASVKSDVIALKAKLLTLSADLRAISDEIKSLNEVETKVFNVSIDTPAVNALPVAYDSLYDSIADLASQSTAYDTAAAQVKNRIANLDELDSTQKSQLIGLLSPLGPSQSLSGAVSLYSDLSIENAQRVSVEAASLPTKVAALEAEADIRVNRALAYLALYGEDASFKKFTNFSTLQEAAAVMLAVENSSRWKNQSDLTKFESAWKSAEQSFTRAQYPAAADFAVTAKALAKKVKDSGIEAAEDPGQQLSSTLVSGLIIILGGIAVILVGKVVWKYVRPKQQMEE